ncbi:MAG: SpoIIE family protein phosphatase [Bacteroidia bacterium]|jgi:PAS domain S-box-containing protein
MNYVLWVIIISSTLCVIVVALSVFLKYQSAEKRLTLIEAEKVNYESIIDQANDAMFVIDIVDGRVHQCNPSAAAMLGYTKKELESKTLFELQPKELLERSSTTVADVWEKKGLIYKDIPFVHKNGHILPVECSAKVAPFAGRPSVVIYARDITERLRLENEVLEQKKIIEVKNKDITDSINYALNIQQALLPSGEKMTIELKEHFILYQPKDIVSGDFYWCDSKLTTPRPNQPAQEVTVVAAVDCTGHGVPGALMSVIGNTILKQIINRATVNNAGEALGLFNKKVSETLNTIKDGMDMALCIINYSKMEFQYAGANNPIYIVRRNTGDGLQESLVPYELQEIKADKLAIGADSGDTKTFTNHVIQLEKGDCIYLFTDGYADQFGGPLGKKLMYKKFKETLLSIQKYSMEEQKNQLYSSFLNWKGDLDQVDDILVIGIRV